MVGLQVHFWLDVVGRACQKIIPNQVASNLLLCGHVFSLVSGDDHTGSLQQDMLHKQTDNRLLLETHEERWLRVTTWLTQTRAM